ncbi:MAG: hypothetical protein M3680_13810 [Myxococcota bacterium]|nr:hypothetical protein [Myxococcota bacterium]
MRTLRQLATAALLISSTAACVTDADQGRPEDVEADVRSGGKGDGETCEFDAMSAETYYKQFAYEETVSGSGTKWYRIGSTFEVTTTLDDGNKIDLDVYFLPDDRIVAEYAELKRIDSVQSENLNKTVIVSRARIDAATRTLTIDGVGRGTPVTMRNDRGCSPGIAFEFTSDLRSPGLAGDSAIVQTVSTTAFVIDPDHLDQVPSETARKWFEEDVAAGKIQIQRK